MKCSDIGNETRPLAVSRPWAEQLMIEFFLQSDLEKQKGLPVLPHMDREKVKLADAQVGFISFVLIPLYTALAQLLPNVKACIENLNMSLTYYKEATK